MRHKSILKPAQAWKTYTKTRHVSMTYVSRRNPSKMNEELGKYTEMTWPRSFRNQHKHVKTCKEYTKEKA